MRVGIAIRIAAAAGIMLVVAAIAYALSSGHVFLFPFLLILGFPMTNVFRKRPPPPPSRPPSMN
jgi:uncharacterized membrane protein